MLWGGHCQDGFAAGAREDMEQLFSYMSRWRSTTKHMLAYNMYAFMCGTFVYTHTLACTHGNKLNILAYFIVYSHVG